jgi:7-carboxy-7-deazaguanine synthase
MSIDAVLAAVDRYQCPTVEITGGEPLLQRDVYPLMDRLLAQGKRVLVETGGHRSIAEVPSGVIRIMDLKCPGSGEAEKMDWDNLGRLTTRDQVKFVLQDRADYEYARDIVTRAELAARVEAVLFSPVHGALEARQLAEWILADRLPVRLQLQVHKFIWPPDTRGV